ncbi:MAG: response regulator transcription factor [Gemmatimonadota bacterium]
MIRILLADDHALVRSGVRSLLDPLAGLEVVGEAANGREALELARALRPDVVVMDVSMPELNGIDAASALKTTLPGLRVLLLSMHTRDALVSQALNAGVDGYLLKDSVPAELEVAIRAVARGDRYLSPALTRALMQRGGAAGTSGGGGELTPRQREILQLVAEGNSTKVIARKLGLKPKTVENHRAHLMDRLGIRDVPGLVRYAISVGLIQPD